MADDNMREALNDITDAMERLGGALHDEDIEDARDAFDVLTEVLNRLRAMMVGPSVPPHGPETA